MILFVADIVNVSLQHSFVHLFNKKWIDSIRLHVLLYSVDLSRTIFFRTIHVDAYLRNTKCMYCSFPNIFLAAPQLVTIAILGIVILFGYSVISFLIYRPVFVEQMGLYCNTLFECFVSASRIGLLDTLGIVSFI